MTPEPDPTMVATDRQVLIIGAGVFLILALPSVGSIGILLAVPITTAIACWLAGRSSEA